MADSHPFINIITSPNNWRGFSSEIKGGQQLFIQITNVLLRGGENEALTSGKYIQLLFDESVLYSNNDPES
jgi:hypothetical protein